MALLEKCSSDRQTHLPKKSHNLRPSDAIQCPGRHTRVSVSQFNPLKLSCKIMCLWLFFWEETHHLLPTLPGDPSLSPRLLFPSSVCVGSTQTPEISFPWAERGDGLQRVEAPYRNESIGRDLASPGSKGVLGSASSGHLVAKAGTMSHSEPSRAGAGLCVPSHCSILGSRVPLGCQGFLQPMFPWRDRNQRRLLPWQPCRQQ